MICYMEKKSRKKQEGPKHKLPNKIHWINAVFVMHLKCIAQFKVYDNLYLVFHFTFLRYQMVNNNTIVMEISIVLIYVIFLFSSQPTI